MLSSFVYNYELKIILRSHLCLELMPFIFCSVLDRAREKADEENELKRLKEENHKLESTVRSLTREISELRSLKVVNSDHPSYGELKLDLIQTKQDLNRAKEALAGM